MKNKKVYDERTDITLFVGTEYECIDFINSHLRDNVNDMDFIWIGNNELLTGG